MASLTPEQKEVYGKLREQLLDIEGQIATLRATAETLTRQVDDSYDEYVAFCEFDNPVGLVEYWLLNNELDELHQEEKKLADSGATYEQIMAWHRGKRGRRCSEIENILGI